MPRAAAEAVASMAAWPWLRMAAPWGSGQPVLLLPGFLAGDELTQLARNFLRQQGFDAHTWAAGTNWGRWAALEHIVLPRVEALADRSGRKVSLVGASMGGLYARSLAQRRPDLVQCVVTLASAAQPPEHSNYIWPVYEAVTNQPEPTMHVPAPMPVPCTSVFSRADGLSNWRPCLQPPGPHEENVGIVSSHTGMMCHPATLYLLGDRLSQPEGDWRPFSPPAFLGGFYSRTSESGLPDAKVAKETAKARKRKS